MGLSRIQPQPWRWCMQVPSHEMQAAGPEPLVPWHPTEGHHRSTTHHAPAPCIGFAKEGQKGQDTKEVLGAWSGGGDVCQYGGLPTEVKSEVQKAGKQSL